MHKLLARQLRRFFKSADAVPQELQPFVAAVEDAYRQSDEDRAMLEHSMETVSLELADRFQKLHDALEQRDEINHTLSVLAATLESTADGIVVVNLDGTVITSNSKFARILGIPQTMLATHKDKPLLESVVEQIEDPDAFVRRVREVYSQPDTDSFDVLRFKDGRVFERYSLPHHIRGVTMGRVWSFRDITERCHLEDQLRQSQKMEAVGLLAGGVAHDFNNLLTVIQAHGEFLEQGVPPSEPMREDVDGIMKAARRATVLTRQLLAFSRKQLLQSVVFDLNTVVTTLEPMLRRLIGEDIEINTRPSYERAIVVADPGQMEQALVNLAINSRDAMPQGGKLTIEIANVQIGEGHENAGTDPTPPGAYVLLAVSDTGVGIPRDQIDRVFEPFFTTKEVGKGTGLGLSTLYGIVKQSGGYVGVSSEVGVGTTFRIYLPRAEGQTTAPITDPGRTAKKAGGLETILVTEDEPQVATIIHRILQAKGYSVLTAGNGKEALAVSAGHAGRIDLLVTDVIMPELGGVELAEQLRRTRPATRVLYISGYTSSEMDRRGVLRAGSAFLQKPFTGSGLALAVRAVLDKNENGESADS